MDEQHDALRAQEGWERYMEAERQDLENRRNGHLRKLLGSRFLCRAVSWSR